MTKISQRKNQIMAITLERGTVSVGELAALLNVSTQTVRRDLDDLCNSEFLQRRHGGVERFEQPRNDPYDQRAATNPDSKWAIANAVAREIPDGATMFISIGTTPTMVAEALRSRKNLTVMTNNLNVAMALSGELSNRILLPGGELRLPDRDLLGAEVLSFFDAYRADFGVFGVAGVASDGALLDFHRSEVQVRETIRANSRVSVLVLDSSKFGRVAPAAGGRLEEMDRVYVDPQITNEYRALLEPLGERLKMVGVNC